MKLTELHPILTVREGPFPSACLTYDCPQCVSTSGHRIRNGIDVDDAPFEKTIGPLWGMAGTSFKDLSLTGSRHSPLRSTRVMGGCKGHWDIVNGEIIFHGDSGK